MAEPITMQCANCGSTAITMTDSSGGVEEGEFTERYECEDCGTPGTITGDAGAPAASWDHNGPLYDGGVA